MIKASVVIPVYNSEKYLDKCVRSLMSQTLKEIELIFVDDGSEDHSITVLEKYRQLDSRIIILKQQHQYAGVARNKGMQESKGKYIIFLDSDDFYKHRMLEDLYSYAEKHQAEIVLFDYNYYDDKTHKKEHACRCNLPDDVFTAEELDDQLFLQCNASPWNKMFLKEFVVTQNLEYQAVKKCNDTYFTQMAIALAKRIVYLKRRYVFYRTNNENSLQGNIEKDRKSFVDCAISVKSALTAKQKYKGVVKQAHIKYVIQLIHFGARKPITQEHMYEYYQYTKSHMIPDLFDDVDDFKEDSFARWIYDSKDYADFLFHIAQDEISEIKNTKDYRIGRVVLLVPRLVKKYIKCL